MRVQAPKNATIQERNPSRCTSADAGSSKKNRHTSRFAHPRRRSSCNICPAIEATRQIIIAPRYRCGINGSMKKIRPLIAASITLILFAACCCPCEPDNTDPPPAEQSPCGSNDDCDLGNECAAYACRGGVCYEHPHNSIPCTRDTGTPGICQDKRCWSESYATGTCVGAPTLCVTVNDCLLSPCAQTYCNAGQCVYMPAVDDSGCWRDDNTFGKCEDCACR